MGEIPHGITSYFVDAPVSLAIVRATDPGFPLLAVNERFSRLTGYEQDEIIGDNCRRLQRHLSHQPGVRELRQFLADPAQNRVRAQLINFRKDGTPFVNLVTLSRLRDSFGKAQYILGSQFDVTHSAADELVSHDQTLRKRVQGEIGSVEKRAMMLGSVHSIGEAAVAITQARLLLGEAESAGML